MCPIIQCQSQQNIHDKELDNLTGVSNKNLKQRQVSCLGRYLPL